MGSADKFCDLGVHVTIFVFVSSFFVSSGSVSEADALLTWKFTFKNQTPSLSSWSDTNINGFCTTWFGVSCNSQGSITSLNLTNSGITGTLQDFPFSSLPNLTSLDLSMNSLSGTISPEFLELSELIHLVLSENQLSGEIPLEIFKLRNLETLRLAQNRLNGSIPSEIGLLTLLQELDLFDNHFAGPLPSSIRNLTNLVKLNLNANSLTGPIPSEIGFLTSLRNLELSVNSLTGPIPSSIGNLTELVVLYLDRNVLTGLVPDSFGNFAKLEQLCLRDNLLSGPLPRGITNSSELIILELDTNNFTGFLPENICRGGGKLQMISVHDNHLEGPLPKSLRDCKTLTRSRFEGNRFVGDISEAFGVYPDLNFIDISRNKFHGEISAKWEESRKLTALIVSDNEITGSVPPEIWNMTQLIQLDLSRNNIYGELPQEIGNLRGLSKLQLNGNHFSGRIPSEIGSLTDLEYLDLSSNRFSFEIPESFKQLSKLYYMNLSLNDLHGDIPLGLTKLTQLSQLDLSENQLYGEIPAQISSLQSLETLNLSRNTLSGLIPTSFAEMHGLRYINMSHNNLGGPIPDSSAFRNASIQALEPNKGLCSDYKQGLKPCDIGYFKHKKSPAKGKHLVVRVVISILGAIAILLFLCVGAAIYHQTGKKRRRENSSSEVILQFLVTNFDGKLAYQEIIKATEDFNPKYLIGTGGSGSVYRAELPGLVLAVKKLHEATDNETSSTPSSLQPQEFSNEITTLTEIRHRNIVKLFGFCSHPRHSFLIYEFLEKGSLAKALRDNEEAKRLDWAKRINIVKSVAHALSYIHHDHSPPFVHRDISSGNVLLDKDYEAKVSDFGTAKLLKTNSTNWSNVVGTYGYMAPELAYSMKATVKCDVYSFGVLAHEVLRGTHPGDSVSSLLMGQEVELYNILDRRLQYPSPSIKEQLVKIIEISIQCMHSDPGSRPSMLLISNSLSQAS